MKNLFMVACLCLSFSGLAQAADHKKKNNMCETDADCVFYVNTCGDLSVLNKNHLPANSEKRNLEKTEYFAHDNKNPPVCQKDFIKQPDVPVNKKPACENNKCVIGSKSA